MRPVTAWLLAIHFTASAAEQFRVKKTYGVDNFFDSFDFRTTGGNPNQNDDNWSWVKYQDLPNAQKKGLAKVKDGEIYLGIDHTRVLNKTSAEGRDSLRVVSKEAFRYGLVITRFTHLPELVCGGWPAYWTLGVGEWPKAGEIDMYEGWNLDVHNKPAIHVGPAAEFGSCTIEQDDQSAEVISGNCDNTFADNKVQWPGQGCQSRETKDTIWASPEGGIQALEWTKDYIKLFTWPHGKEPENLDDDELDTSSWGKPTVQIRASKCDIDGIFQKQQLMFTLPVCGNPPGSDQFWKELDGGSGKTCDKVTREPTCIDFVAKNPHAFKNFYFQIKDIRYFEQRLIKPTNNTSMATSTSTRSMNRTRTVTSLTTTMSMNHTTSLTATMSKNQTSLVAPSAVSLSKNQTRITTATAPGIQDGQKDTQEAATVTSTASMSRVSCKHKRHGLRHI
ncbi:beta-1,3-endoglucanase [Metarhizium acridum CQMa 102]|uniref:Beta-1,3-endoglucanase n=1 Tax=Metarhizium acridum (strain CQMa 102) TaxID=655827 RepID=E9E9R2_METAQ|nr:beta-1,3-endoglucanase [Metarhizium acridum CQMa 102]EFY87375.1 beta-1,3-endoglucanase [Metarhizium acridum CQMa 102]